jgi:putative RNA 2'-phosphotransferase
MSLVLRHNPCKAGLTLAPDGWCDVSELLRGMRTAGHGLTWEELLALVAADSKGRYAFSADGHLIRANQGHSLSSVSIDHEIASPPPVLWHGTVGRVLDAIRREGLRPMRRHHVHLSPDRETATAVGARRGVPVVLRVDAAAMAAAGHVFRRSENDVWLADAVPPEFLQLDALAVKRP